MLTTADRKKDLNLDVQDCASLKKEIRDTYERVIYMNTGSSGPVPYSFYRSLEKYKDDCHDFGPGALQSIMNLKANVSSLRNSISLMIGCGAESVALMHNTTDGINKAINSINWKNEDEIVIAYPEYISLMLPALRASKIYGAKLKIVPCDENGDYLIDDIFSSVSRKTRMIIMSHVNYFNGTRNDVRKVCAFAREKGIITLVDGAQAVGCIPVNVSEIGCDFYPFPAHKWLLGEEGAGALYVSKEVLSDITPPSLGYHSVSSYHPDKGYILKPDASMFEDASFAYLSLYVFKRAIDFYLTSASSIQSEISRLTTLLKKKILEIPSVKLITPLDFENSSGLISFQQKEFSSLDTCEKLFTDFRIVARTIPFPDCVRASVHFFNTDDDINKLISFLK
ncbi:MAG: aminotransferase class V-fold PLP-dependent enzyme [Candidatus Riflebacteria bacterium]|nr:aminotransferase class V-fold PLP-dependent enzyme [Candidatus Riflebacteria bacterium]